MVPSLARSILVATDLGPSSDDTVRTAAKLAALTGAELHLLHVVDFPAVLPRAPEIGAPTFFGRFQAAERALKAQILRTVPADVVVGSRRVTMYAVDKAVAEYALSVDADLIVLGACRGRTDLHSKLSTTADRVIQTVDVPCLIAHRTLSVPLRRVVVPVDPGEPTSGPVEWGLHWCRALGAQQSERAPHSTVLTVLHVLPRAPGEGFVRFARGPANPGWNHAPGGVAEQAEAAPEVITNEERLWGERPAREIARFAERESADLLVVAARGHGVLRRLFFGSTSCALAREAPCPVLLLPPRLRLATAAEPINVRESAPDGTRDATAAPF